MSECVSWVLQTKINDGQLDNFKTLMTEMVEATKTNESGALCYEWFISEDNTSCHIYERYENSEATMTHLGAFGENFAKRFMGCVTPKGITVYGNPSDQVRGALKGMGAVHFSNFGGFAR